MSNPSERRASPLGWILATSVAISGFLIWWIYFKTTAVSDASWIQALPAANATFNSLCAVCLVGGYVSIRNQQRETHRRFMLAALSFSALFLGSYLLYHHYHGDTPFTAQGWIRPVYFAILISHIVLSVVMLPMILGTVNFAFRGRFASHRRVARWTLPVWLYVSVTGVAVFFFLELFN